jgi:UDP-glucuronate 4-epimerase
VVPLRIIVTGAAGFIGAHVAAALARRGHSVFGCDAFTGYYDPRLKHDRVKALLGPLGVTCARADLIDPDSTAAVFKGSVDRVVHLAAQPGVRRSLSEPRPYIEANLVAFAHVLDAVRAGSIDRLLYASSSSVYGSRNDVPFRESDRVDRPASLYAATKAANELLAHAYAQTHALDCLGLRFFTVYGPWGRPDMACFQFARAIRRGEPVTLFGQGRLLRDFTFIADTVDAVVRLVEQPSRPTTSEVVNIGHRQPVSVHDFVTELGNVLGVAPRLLLADAPLGDVPVTCADDSRLVEMIGPWPHTPLAEGLEAFVRWLRAWEPDPVPELGPVRVRRPDAAGSGWAMQG